MTDTEQKALALVREVLNERNLSDKRAVRREVSPYTEALCRAIEQHEAQAAEIEQLRAEAKAQFDRGYYDGSTHPIVRHDALREALADLLHAVCGKTGFAETVRRDSGRIYPWPALDLAEAKARAALEQGK
jgi:hypothetical protein